MVEKKVMTDHRLRIAYGRKNKVEERYVKRICTITGLILGISFTCLGCNIINNDETTQKGGEKKMEIEDVVRDDKLIEVKQSVVGDNYYIIGGDKNTFPCSIPSRYVIGYHTQLRTNVLEKEIEGKNQYEFQYQLDRLLLEIYSIESGEYLKTIDAKAILEKECPEFQIAYANGIYSMRRYQGAPCISFDLAKRPNTVEEALEDTLHIAYLNVDTEEFIMKRYPSEQWEYDQQADSPMAYKVAIFNDRDYSFLDLNEIKNTFIGYYGYWKNTYCIRLPIINLPDENEVLYTMFPELKERVKNAKNQEWASDQMIPYVDIYLTDDPTSEEMIRLILPEGQEISFEGMGISKSKSVDGVSHEIHSFEDYLLYLKPDNHYIDESELYPIFTNKE